MDASLRAFREASAFHLSHGTMTMFPTTMACPLDELFEVFSAFRQAKPVCVPAGGPAPRGAICVTGADRCPGSELSSPSR